MSAEWRAAGDLSPPVSMTSGTGGDVGVRGREASTSMALDEMCAKNACRAETGFEDVPSSSSLVSRNSGMVVRVKIIDTDTKARTHGFVISTRYLDKIHPTPRSNLFHVA